MADQRHLDLIKQGVDTWNEWRKFPKPEKIDLTNADLGEADLVNANLVRANFYGANLSAADLRLADFSQATLSKANLTEADLSDADLRGANLVGTDLRRANLSVANLRSADLTGADLRGSNCNLANLSRANLNKANFRGANLKEANLKEANLKEADFTDTIMSSTIFVNVDFREVKGLSTVQHTGPSDIGIISIHRSLGQVPEIFLRNAGVPENFITYIPSLVGKAIDYYTCFISYSSKDQAFAERLHADLQSKGVRCWFAPIDMRTGDRIRDRIDESIRLYDKLLLVLSEHSVESRWVEFEVEAAINKESPERPPVLFPIRLDTVVLNSTMNWAANIRETRYITDFSGWETYSQYQLSLNRLLRDLRAGQE